MNFRAADMMQHGHAIQTTLSLLLHSLSEIRARRHCFSNKYNHILKIAHSSMASFAPPCIHGQRAQDIPFTWLFRSLKAQGTVRLYIFLTYNSSRRDSQWHKIRAQMSSPSRNRWSLSHRRNTKKSKAGERVEGKGVFRSSKELRRIAKAAAAATATTSARLSPQRAAPA